MQIILKLYFYFKIILKLISGFSNSQGELMQFDWLMKKQYGKLWLVLVLEGWPEAN